MALKTLVYGLDQCGVSNIGDDLGRILFINAQAHSAIVGDVTYVQWFKPYADMLGGNALQRIEDVRSEDIGAFDTVLILIPKNMTEARYLVASGLQALKPDGALYCACENKAGGTRLQKMLQQFGVEIVQQISKHKSRFLQVKNNNLDAGMVENMLAAGCVQGVDKTGFISQSGIYGWDKIDRGSEVLLRHIPDDLKGVIADFGCGYGYLLQHILQQNTALKLAYAIDADARALNVAAQNVAGDERVQYVWADLTKPKGIPTKLDTIVMNPPFHEGKRADSDIGIAFIKTAAASLKRGGALYMVANNQLPYEAVLENTFFSHEVLAQENGFKVFRAIV